MGLPGGAIEFSETLEDALKRELLEETALSTGTLELLHIATSTREFDKDGEPYGFHHIGMIYKVITTNPVSNLQPEEKMRWLGFADIKQEELTPFAKLAISKYMPIKAEI